MGRNEYGQSRNRAGMAIGRLALIMLVVLTVVPLASGASKKDKEATRIYSHTYDEVFQASLETIERMGYFVTAKDKDKGTISGDGIVKLVMGSAGPENKKCSFDIHIETLNTSPQTRVTINATVKCIGGWAPANTLKETFLTELQKVLSTYR